MKVVSNGIDIHLEQEEVIDFWNIIMFALDYHVQQEKDGKSCMTNDEYRLAKQLEEITDKLK
jgi:hypothetical protein